MHILSVYTLSFASVVGMLFIWRIWRLIQQSTRVEIWAFFRKRFIYTLLLRRLRASSDINFLSGLFIIGFVATNILICTIWIRKPAEIAKRCGTMFIINFIPLYLGGRTNFIVDRVLRLQLNEYHLLHRWLGRVCVFQGLYHGVMNTGSPSINEILLISFLAALGGLSFVYLRMHMYELFSKAHLVFAVALAVTLWTHIHLFARRAIVCLGIASATWLIQHAIWLGRIIYQRTRSRSSAIVGWNKFASLDPNGSEALVLQIGFDRQCKIGPGQYIYITIPGASIHTLSIIQTHPFVVAWVEESTITIIVERNKGFSNAIFNLAAPFSHSIIVDGPYGCVQSLGNYDKVLFMASGIGVAAHLVHVQHLLQAHKAKSARVRRVTLIWFLETPDQDQWADEFLQRLQRMDSSNEDGHHIFTLHKYTTGIRFPIQEERLLITSDVLDIGMAIDGEAGADGGNTAVSVCAGPHFESYVRKEVRSSNRDIHLFMAGFRPEESEAGRKARARYH